MDDLVARLPPAPLDPPAAPDPDGRPHATYAGVMEFAGRPLRVYQLSDGRRIIDAADLHAFLADGGD